MQTSELLDRLDAQLRVIEESGAGGWCPSCGWHPNDGPQHPTSCAIGALRSILDELDELGEDGPADADLVPEPLREHVLQTA